MKILAIIPARSGSKGISKKNIKLFNRKPLIYYSIRLAQEAEKRGIIVDHIVSTDDEETASVAKEMGENVPFLRPRELATDDSAVIDTVIHAVCWWEQYHKDVLHSVLLLQPTNPLTTLKDIEDSIECYLDNQPGARCLISVCDAQHLRLSTLYHKKDRCLEQLLKETDPVARRQSLERLYQRNGAIYIARRDLLLTEHRIVNESPLFFEMPRFRSISIDDTFDWDIAGFLMEHNKSL